MGEVCSVPSLPMLHSLLYLHLLNGPPSNSPLPSHTPLLLLMKNNLMEVMIDNNKNKSSTSPNAPLHP